MLKHYTNSIRVAPVEKRVQPYHEEENNIKKRILTSVLAAALVTGTCAATVSAKEEKTYTIGICQLVQHDALDAATKGFEDAITEKMGDSVKFDEQNAQGDSNTCSTIINSFVSEGADLILANATASLQAAAAGTSDIPILGTAAVSYTHLRAHETG